MKCVNCKTKLIYKRDPGRVYPWTHADGFVMCDPRISGGTRATPNPKKDA